MKNFFQLHDLSRSEFFCKEFDKVAKLIVLEKEYKLTKKKFESLLNHHT